MRFFQTLIHESVLVTTRQPCSKKSRCEEIGRAIREGNTTRLPAAGGSVHTRLNVNVGSKHSLRCRRSNSSVMSSTGAPMAIIGPPNRVSMNSATTGHSGSSGYTYRIGYPDNPWHDV